MRVLTLPPDKNGRHQSVDVPSGRLVIIGANGAGKTRFAARLADEADDRPVFQISALRGLYGSSSRTDGIHELYSKIPKSLRTLPDSAPELDMLMAVIMHRELVDLLAYKMAASGERTHRPQRTVLDRLISLWQSIFPGNDILVESGQMMFTSDNWSNPFEAPKLSDGERTALYHIGAVLLAPRDATVIVESPEMFLHTTIASTLWRRLEEIREDLVFVHVTHDVEFVGSRQDSPVVWVRGFDGQGWDYRILPPGKTLSPEIYSALAGPRRPILFIEGDGKNSIDARLYPLIFRDYTVRSLGSCNRVIEATRSLRELTDVHHLQSLGIVDRDRRDPHEVEYLRTRDILVPDVAEIENMLLIEDVIRIVAESMGKQPDDVFRRVKRSIIAQFRHDIPQQAMLHTRHKIRKLVEFRIDGRFADINAYERHIRTLLESLKPRRVYEETTRLFTDYVRTSDYRSVLRVYNQKSMLSACNVAGLCGLHDKDAYIAQILKLLRGDDKTAHRLRSAFKSVFNFSTVPDKCKN